MARSIYHDPKAADIKDSDLSTPIDFMPVWDVTSAKHKKEEVQSVDSMKEMLLAMAASVNSKIEKKRTTPPLKHK